MDDSLDDINEIEKKDLSAVLAAGTALFVLVDACYMYYTQKYMGGAKSLFQKLNLTNETNYAPQLALDIYYIAFFSGISIFY